MSSRDIRMAMSSSRWNKARRLLQHIVGLVRKWCHDVYSDVNHCWAASLRVRF